MKRATQAGQSGAWAGFLAGCGLLVWQAVILGMAWWPLPAGSTVWIAHEDWFSPTVWAILPLGIVGIFLAARTLRTALHRGGKGLAPGVAGLLVSFYAATYFHLHLLHAIAALKGWHLILSDMPLSALIR